MLLQNLYVANVRKVVVMGLAPIGCAPYYLWLYGSRNGRCNDFINYMILEFNFAMRYIVEELNDELLDFNAIFCDAYEGSMHILKNYKHFGKIICLLKYILFNLSSIFISWLIICFLFPVSGFNVTSSACCGFGRYKGGITCLSPEMACSNASNYLWWDQFHPTDAVNAILADNIWSGLNTNMCSPVDLQDMLTQSAKS